MTVPNEHRWALKPVHIDGLPPWIDIDPANGLSIGRADDNDVTLAADDHAVVSGHHVRISMREGTPRLIDLESTNHTYVNGIQVHEKVLKSGDVIGLGAGGPRFVVELRGDLSATRLMTSTHPEQKFGESTIQLVRKAVGLEQHHAGITAAVEERTRKNRRIFVSVLAFVVVIGGAVAWSIWHSSAEELQRLSKLNEDLTAALDRTSKSLSDQTNAWESERERLRNEKTELTERIRKLESGGQASTATLSDLRNRLEATTKNLALFDPVSVERNKLAIINGVRNAVVFITTEIGLKERDGDRLLRRIEHADGSIRVELGDAGEVLANQQTGSGFVVDERGHILTNAHVVEPEEAFEEVFTMPDGTILDPVVASVSVVFHGTAERHAAEVVEIQRDGEHDFGLLKIEPFPGMPYIVGFDPTVTPPEEGSEVFLFGFPLGKHILQGRDDEMFASTFKGILSRRVDPFLQVDAAVHPGNSGGPMIDAKGRVVGIVTAVARMPDGPIAPDIGYVYPIGAIEGLWPPK